MISMGEGPSGPSIPVDFEQVLEVLISHFKGEKDKLDLRNILFECPACRRHSGRLNQVSARWTCEQCGRHGDLESLARLLGTSLKNIGTVESPGRQHGLLKPSTPLGWPEPPAQEAFYGIVGEMVRAIEPHTEADPAALLTNFLVAAGNALGPGPYAFGGTDQHRLNLDAVLVGLTSKGRKGSSWSPVKAVLSEVDPGWAANCIQEGLSSGEGVIWAVRDPVLRGLEEVEPGVADKRLMVVESEFVGALKQATREGNVLSAVLRRAWDSGDLQVLTKNSPAKATGAHVSIVGHITQDELLRYMGDVEAANGFGNRFLWVCTKRARCHPEGGGKLNLGDLPARLEGVLEAARRLEEIRRDEPARAVWAEVYPALSEGRPGLVGSITARAEAQVLRLSALYAALDGSSLIGVPHLQAALAVWEYCEASAQYIFGGATGDAVADRILAALRSSGKPLSRTEVSGALGRSINAGRIEKALGFLEAEALAKCERRGTAGRPVEMWAAVGQGA